LYGLPNGDFYFSNLDTLPDLSYFNKYCMDFNPVKCTTKIEHWLSQAGMVACGTFIEGV